MTDINQYQYIVLAALRDAAMIRREPKTLTPDGHESWFTLERLASEDRLYGLPAGVFEVAVRSLRRRNLVVGRTLHTRVNMSVTRDGLDLVFAVEAAAGVTALLAADREVNQARENTRQAKRREAAALERVTGLAGHIIRLTPAEIVAASLRKAGV
jgi:hypothetical protein